MTEQLLRSFRFEITLRQSAEAPAGSAGKEAPSGASSGDLLAPGAFQECTGLEIEMDVQEYLEGGRNDGVIQRVGRAKYAPLVLKRGMWYGNDGEVNRALWEWL